MAKNSDKKGPRGVNPRSRAAKRATSPSIDVDRTIKEAPRAKDATPVLAALRGGGILKKKKKVKSMTRGQRARQEKGLSRAEAVMDQMSKKVEGAKSRKRKVDQRRAVWEDINDVTKEEKRKADGGPGREIFDTAQEGERVADGDDTDMGVVTIAVDHGKIPLPDHKGNSVVTVDDEIDLIS